MDSTVRLTETNVKLLTAAIAEASWQKWSSWLLNFVGWMTVGIGVNSALSYTEDTIQIALRNRLTALAHSLYMKSLNFYHTSVLKSGGLENLDQIICGDIHEFCFALTGLYGHSFKPILEFALTLSTSVRSLGWVRPFALFGFMGMVGAWVRRVSPSIATVVADSAALEGKFRHSHSRLIQHAEEIAFLNGSSAELRLLNSQLSSMLETFAHFNILRLGKKIADQFLKFQGPLAGGIFVHVPFLNNPQMTPEHRITAFRATEVIMLRCGSAFGETMLLHKRFAKISGYTKRIAELFEFLERAASERAAAGPLVKDADDIQFSGVTVKVPRIRKEALRGKNGGRKEEQEQEEEEEQEEEQEEYLLVKDLNLKISPGTNVMVTGPNGCGKTSLFRCLAGLWGVAAGEIRAPRDSIMMLPQRPYLVQGSLRDQVTYPTVGKKASPAEDEEIQRCLKLAGLKKILNNPDGLDLRHDEWNTVLSGGERQRLGFARLFYARPKFAILDESTSAINADHERELYDAVLQTKTTVISIAHRLALRKYHQVELRFHGDGQGGYDLMKTQS